MASVCDCRRSALSPLRQKRPLVPGGEQTLAGEARRTGFEPFQTFAMSVVRDVFNKGAGARVAAPPGSEFIMVA